MFIKKQTPPRLKRRRCCKCKETFYVLACKQKGQRLFTCMRCSAEGEIQVLKGHEPGYWGFSPPKKGGRGMWTEQPIVPVES